jgi:glycosyltransferase involved in cell wall biosynthesis
MCSDTIETFTASTSSLAADRTRQRRIPYRPVPASLDVSVVVCTRDRPRLLGDALAALQPALAYSEVVVVDSASRSDETARVATEAGFRVVRLTQPGLSRARNAGIAATAGEFVAFTDDDCLPGPTWVEQIATAFADPLTGVVMGRLVPEHEGGAVPADDPGDEPFTFRDGFDVDKLGAGANMAFRRRALLDVGGFDEMLGAGSALRSAEDHDAIWRILRGGWSGRYDPGAVVAHRDWRRRTDLIRMRYAYGLGAGALAAKVVKVDPGIGWPMLRHRIMRDGLATGASDVARRYKAAAIGDVLYTTGVLVGAARVWRRPVVAGLFRAKLT